MTRRWIGPTQAACRFDDATGPRGTELRGSGEVPARTAELLERATQAFESKHLLTERGDQRLSLQAPCLVVRCLVNETTSRGSRRNDSSAPTPAAHGERASAAGGRRHRPHRRLTSGQGSATRGGASPGGPGETAGAASQTLGSPACPPTEASPRPRSGWSLLADPTEGRLALGGCVDRPGRGLGLPTSRSVHPAATSDRTGHPYGPPPLVPLPELHRLRVRRPSRTRAALPAYARAAPGSVCVAHPDRGAPERPPRTPQELTALSQAARACCSFKITSTRLARLRNCSAARACATPGPGVCVNVIRSRRLGSHP